MPTILIADDSLFQRMMLGKAAKAEGFDTQEARNGRECLELIRESRPDAVVLDLNMPEVDGMGVMTALREEGITLPILVLTADIQTSTQQRCLALGAVAVLNKPVDEDTLRARLRGLDL